MGKFFSDAVEQALEYIYYRPYDGKGKEGFDLLERAAAEKDADAVYFLSRCYSGAQYVWEFHAFPEDDEKVAELVKESIRLGSAVGVLGAMRCGELTPATEKNMPFSSLKEAWDAVYEKAKGGEPFCQYMIGNTYYFGDILTIDKHEPSEFPSTDEYVSHLKNTFMEAIPWLEKAFRNGVSQAGGNLYSIYEEGEKGVLDPQPEKAAAVVKLGAELGHARWQERYAEELKESGRETESLEWYKKAMDQGQLSSCFYVGLAYEKGEIVPKDVRYAFSIYEKGMQNPNRVGCFNRAAALLFHGEDGITQDYERAVRLFEYAHSQESNWGNDMLAICYLMGYGCKKDPVRARQLLEEVDWHTPLLYYGLGLIYADGLGVEEDIKKGVEYLQKAGEYQPARETLVRFKKTIFGKWVRRK